MRRSQLLRSHLRRPDRAAVCCGGDRSEEEGKGSGEKDEQEGKGEKEGGLKCD